MGNPDSHSRDPGAVADRISEEIASIYGESYGDLPTSVRTHVLDDAVPCICDVDLLPHERLIVGSGSPESVRSVRKAFQETIEATFFSTVEHMTGRRVVAFISDMHLDPSFTIEFFRLGPEAEYTLEDP